MLALEGILRSAASDVTPSAAFGLLAVSAVLVWPFFRSRTAALLTQSVGAGSFALHFLAIGSATAAAASCIALLQLVAVTTIRHRRPLCFAYAATTLLLLALVVVTWHGWPSILAGTGSLVATAARLQRSLTLMKVGFLISGPFWAAHNLIVGSVFGSIVDAVSLGSNAAALCPLVLRVFRERVIPAPAAAICPSCIPAPGAIQKLGHA